MRKDIVKIDSFKGIWLSSDLHAAHYMWEKLELVGWHDPDVFTAPV